MQIWQRSIFSFQKVQKIFYPYKICSKEFVDGASTHANLAEKHFYVIKLAEFISSGFRMQRGGRPQCHPSRLWTSSCKDFFWRLTADFDPRWLRSCCILNFSNCCDMRNASSATRLALQKVPDRPSCISSLSCMAAWLLLGILCLHWLFVMILFV